MASPVITAYNSANSKGNNTSLSTSGSSSRTWAVGDVLVVQLTIKSVSGTVSFSESSGNFGSFTTWCDLDDGSVVRNVVAVAQCTSGFTGATEATANYPTQSVKVVRTYYVTGCDGTTPVDSANTGQNSGGVATAADTISGSGFDALFVAFEGINTSSGTAVSASGNPGGSWTSAGGDSTCVGTSGGTTESCAYYGWTASAVSSGATSAAGIGDGSRSVVGVVVFAAAASHDASITATAIASATSMTGPAVVVGATCSPTAIAASTAITSPAVSTAPSGTVTFSSTTTGTVGSLLKVYVLTGATEAGGNTASHQFGSPGSASLTPAYDNSLPIWGVCNYGGSTAFTAATGNTLTDDSTLGSTGHNAGDGYYSSSVSAGVAVTVGVSAPAQNTNMTAYEVPPSSTIAIDSSTPAVATGSTGATSPTFSPPAGSVLVAVVAQYASGGSAVSPAISDSGLGGLTWTQRNSLNGSGASYTAIFTATVPSGTDANTSPSVIASATAMTAPAASAGAGPSPSAISSSTGLVAPSITTEVFSAPAAIAASSTLTTPVAHANASPAPSAIAVATTTTAPGISISVDAPPAAIQSATSLTAPALTVLSGYAATSTGLAGSWASLASAEGSAQGDYASGTGV